MHEYLITERLLNIALENAHVSPGERISRLKINLDPDAGYTPDSIRFYFEQLAQNTAADGAELVFDQAPSTQHIQLVTVEVSGKENGMTETTVHDTTRTTAREIGRAHV